MNLFCARREGMIINHPLDKLFVLFRYFWQIYALLTNLKYASSQQFCFRKGEMWTDTAKSLNSEIAR